MKTVLYAADAASAEGYARVLRELGYGTEVRLVAGTEMPELVAVARDASMVFIELALGADTIAALCTGVRDLPSEVPSLIALLGEPEDDVSERLIAAGANMFFPADVTRLRLRTRFLRGAVQRRIELANALGELRALKARYASVERENRALLEHAPSGVIVHRRAKIVWVNEGFGRIVGRAPAELIGQPVAVLAAPQHRAIIEERARLREDGQTLPTMEIPLLHADGHDVPALGVSSTMMFDAEPAYVVFIRDLTEHRRLEGQLMASDRLASLGRLAASVGHEINNPLTYVIGNLQLALRRMRAGAVNEREVPQMLAEALEGAERVQRIVEDLRVFSQPKHQVATSVDVVQVIESCVRMTAGEVRHRARVVRTFEDVPPVRAAEARVAQVITNLLLNAAQAMPDGEADRHAITIVARAVGDVVEIRVEDDGVGIAPEHLPHVFEPFFTTKTERGGTGLGLSICRMLVSSQGGTLDLESERGRGTRVTLKLPCASAFDSPAPLRGEVAPHAAAKRVLVVDDEARVAELLRDNLSPHQVTIATSGRDALTAIATSPPFDAIVCDLMMPELWGADVHGQIRALHPGMERRLVFMTGGAFTPTAAEFLASVPNECLRKPFAIERLLEAIEHAAHVT